MPDVALSATSSPLAALLSGGAADSPKSAAGREQNMFAALLDGASGAKPSAAGKGDGAVPVAIPATTGITDISFAPPASPMPVPPAPAANVAPQIIAKPGGAPAEPQPAAPDTAIAAPRGRSEDPDAGEKAKDEDDTDELADAIASGPTAVLALAPTIVTAIQPQQIAQTPVHVDAPVTPKSLNFGSAGPSHPAFKTRIAKGEVPPDTQTQIPANPTAPQTAATMDTEAGMQQAAPQSPPQPAAPQPPREQAQTLVQGQAQLPKAPVADARPAATLRSNEAATMVAAAPQQAQAAPASVAQTMPPAAAETASAKTKPAVPEPVVDDKATSATAAQADATPAPVPSPAAAPAAAPDPAAAVAIALPAKPQPEPRAPAQQPVVQHAPTEAAAPPAAGQPRRRSEEAAAPRRSGNARRRTESAPIDAATAGIDTRAPGTVQATVSRPVTDVQGKADTMIEQTLTIAKDGAWLDSLAKDIANAGSGNNLHFKLNPENLGALSVAISQKDDGASIRLTADNQQTRDILVDAQPKLVAEARAQGLKVSETQVDVRQEQNQSQNQSANQDAQRWAQHQTGQNAMSQNGQNRQSSPGHQPFVSNLRRKAEADSESPHGDSDALYA